MDNYTSKFTGEEIDERLDKVGANAIDIEALKKIIADIYNKTETDNKITEKVSEIVSGAPEDFNTLKEMYDWLTEHEDSAAAMNSEIQTNKVAIATKMNISDIVPITQSEYDALETKTAQFYFIKEGEA